jgi:arsenical pump membrane protein
VKELRAAIECDVLAQPLNGALKFSQEWLASTQQLAPAVRPSVIGFAVAIGNNLVNNLPLGLIAGGTLLAARAKSLIADAVVIGVDPGPNLSGSLATILGS